ncbi:hypothetical protein [Alkalicoccobacillus gibsonii]|uniref:hypothetical protein n=1 Tax=Alkalicoccobacillus gibsonii TaxID=79881 RepID=UPI0019337569|nr:hypothetical protein [Alkalicoccobacillus gibsonii]MBM0066481.1 hypothetical protein [Alkalicoccobacillus gibsonii]
MDLLLEYNWELFIAAEVMSVLALLLFGISRYWFIQGRTSYLFIGLFLLLLVLEALLGLYVYQQTGEISTFLIIITLFVLYACTFGIFDFIRLDRWMRSKIGKLRGVELLTDKDYRMIERTKDPKYKAKKYRLSSTIHLIVFFAGQYLLWSWGTSDLDEMISYASDLSWIEDGDFRNSPYQNDAMFAVGTIWGIVFVADFLYSWSYTLFPSSK